MATPIPAIALDSVLTKSEPMPEGSEEVKGYDFNEGVDYKKMFQAMSRTGFQATSVGNAITEINRMIDCKLQPIPEDQTPEVNPNPWGRPMTNCTIFLSYTSNLVSAGTREVIRYLVQNNMVDVIVSTAGGIEEDYIKCMAPTYMGDFSLPGKVLKSKGINRTGNLLVPNGNYCQFEKWIMPILDKMLEEQKEQGTIWTPSKMIWRLGKEIDNPESIYYWAYKNSIPVLSPAITDGSIGDMLFFHSYLNPGLVIDLVQDVRLMDDQAIRAVNSGMLILGGGLVKHHTCNANMMRRGADFSIYVNTSSEFDGSDAGARPDEAISWGKIKTTAKPVKVYADATVIAPILVAETFASRQKEFEDFFAGQKK